jgi:hypothetical protein
MKAESLFNFILIFLIAFGSKCTSLIAQNPSWQWVKSATGNHYDIAQNSCTDASGNTIVTGNYFSTPLNFQNSSISSSGGYDVFIAII